MDITLYIDVIRVDFVFYAKRYLALQFWKMRVYFSLYLFIRNMVESSTEIIDFAKVLRALFLSPG